MNIQNLIAEDKIREAINALMDMQIDAKYLNELSIISGNYSRIEKLKRLDTINNDEYFLSINKLRYSILSIFEEIRSEKNVISKTDENLELIELLKYRFERIMNILKSISSHKVGYSSTEHLTVIELELIKKEENAFSNHKESLEETINQLSILHQLHIEALSKNKLIIANDIANDIHYILYEVLQFDIAPAGVAYYSLPSMTKLIGRLYCSKNGFTLFDFWENLSFFDIEKILADEKLDDRQKDEILIQKKFYELWSYDTKEMKFEQPGTNVNRLTRIRHLILSKNRTDTNKT